MQHTVWPDPTCNLNPDGLVTTLARPGQLFETEDGMTAYRYVKFDNGNAVAAAVGNICYWLDRSAGTVTSDVSKSAPSLVAGVFQAVITDGYHCMILVRGEDTLNTNGDDDILKGDAIIPTTTDGVVDSISEAATNDGGDDAPEYFWHVIGVAMATDNSAADTVLTQVIIE